MDADSVRRHTERFWSYVAKAGPDDCWMIHKDIGAVVGVDKTTIGKIASGANWSHVK